MSGRDFLLRGVRHAVRRHVAGEAYTMYMVLMTRVLYKPF